MTKFNPQNKIKLTYGECLSPAMEITDKADAIQYLRGYINFTQNHLDNHPNSDGKTAEQICKTNLGYYAGYYNDETRQRVEELFECSHPIFGSIEDNGSPSAIEAFNKGKEIGERKL